MTHRCNKLPEDPQRSLHGTESTRKQCGEKEWGDGWEFFGHHAGAIGAPKFIRLRDQKKETQPGSWAHQMT
jgi:hypothetical protein